MNCISTKLENTMGKEHCKHGMVCFFPCLVPSRRMKMSFQIMAKCSFPHLPHTFELTFREKNCPYQIKFES